MSAGSGCARSERCLLMPSPAGVMFQDVTTLLLNPVAFKDSIELFRERYAGMNIQAIAGATGWLLRVPKLRCH